jgi:hypothetical protein
MTTGEAPVLPFFLRRLVLFAEARQVRPQDIHRALVMHGGVRVPRTLTKRRPEKLGLDGVSPHHHGFGGRVQTLQILRPAPS